MLVERFRNCSLVSLCSTSNTLMSRIWFLLKLRVIRCSNSMILLTSAMALVLKSRCSTCLYFSTLGNILSSYFSASDIFTYPMVVLSAVLPNNDKDPLNASFNFLTSSSFLILAYSSSFFRYSSLRRSSYSRCFCY